jgi:tetratricopeptide (TPR) repeat protein
VREESGEKLLGEGEEAMSRDKRRKHGSQEAAPTVVPFGMPSGADARLAEFLETAERLKKERDTAGSVMEMVEATPPEAWPTLAAVPELQTNAALEVLGEEVRRRLDRNPREALALAELATTIADALPRTAYPAVTLAQIRATAWKDLAKTLRFLGRYDETFRAIERAEEILEKHVALGLDRAVVDLVKALAFIDTGRYDEARALAMTCGSVFLAHGDLTRALYAGEIEANVLYEERRYTDAQALYHSLLDVARAADDDAAEARFHNNAGYCAMQLDDFRTANIHFSEAIAKLTDLGEKVAATRTQWGAGLVLVGRGQTEHGLQYLSAARQSFADFGMVEEASLCGLSIAEALLSRGDADSARLLVRDVAEQFRESHLEHRIIEAVGALEQTLADDNAPIDAVRNVYAMIESARAQQSRL